MSLSHILRLESNLYMLFTKYNNFFTHFDEFEFSMKDFQTYQILLSCHNSCDLSLDVPHIQSHVSLIFLSLSFI